MAGLVLVTGLGLIIAGTATTLAFKSYLTSRAMTQVSQLRDQVASNPESSLNLAPSTPGTLIAVIANGRITDFRASPELHDDKDPQPDLEQIQPLASAPIGRTTKISINGTDYFATAIGNPNGRQLAVAVSLEDADEVVHALITTQAIAFALLLVAIAIGGWFLIRLSLRPLERVASAASEVASADLHTGTVSITSTLSDLDNGTEVGRVASAVNSMLDNVVNSVNAREISERQKSQFVSDAGHELRTPLQAIAGYAELIRQAQANQSEINPAWAKRIESATTRMAVLVEDLLMLASLDEGRPLRTEQFDVTPSIAILVSDASVASPDHQWIQQFDPTESILITSDQGMLQQVVANLLTNARAHTPAGTTVTVAVEQQQSRLLIHVVDDGPGIDPQLLERITHRFVRADSGRSRSLGGSGLGLAIASSLAANLEGELTVMSPVHNGHGTRGTLTLPLT